ncbi:ABC transporter substrate-binding protein [Amorphus orientalis]|uniref:Hydroxymethylpyrimidine transport system substrate-binding protein n=1 Tax=Amorphus orientalis TaxID=649198 RepID=A0AAE3VR92_9HYPH|nr:ABC transporter substrate-binding protein [Amorphus orientalis]MDQ0316703.1 putative hydroxymethylpyrimidine transport system substrate-binding protein [Amorphus orientalis]
MLRLAFASIVAVLALSGSASAQEQRLTVLLDWYLNPDHAPLVVAEERGYFADEGLAVELVTPSDPSAPPRLVAAGEGDIAVTYQPSLYQQAEEGLPLARIGTLVATPLNTLVALADGPIERLEDLKGKTIGYSVAGFEDALLAAMLGSVGMSLDDVNLVNVNFALTPSLLSKRVDAVIGAYRNIELPQLALQGAEGRAFYPEEHGVPAYDELVFVAATDRLDDPALKAFLRAIERAVMWQTNHPEAALELFVSAHPDLDDEHNRLAFAETIRRFALRPAALDTGRYERFASFMKERGLIEDVKPVETYAVELD